MLNERSRLASTEVSISDTAFHDLTIAECTCQISNIRGGYIPCDICSKQESYPSFLNAHVEDSIGIFVKSRVSFTERMRRPRTKALYIQLGVVRSSRMHQSVFLRPSSVGVKAAVIQGLEASMEPPRCGYMYFVGESMVKPSRAAVCETGQHMT
jgi:hypothetical protein